MVATTTNIQVDTGTISIMTLLAPYFNISSSSSSGSSSRSPAALSLLSRRLLGLGGWFSSLSSSSTSWLYWREKNISLVQTWEKSQLFLHRVRNARLFKIASWQLNNEQPLGACGPQKSSGIAPSRKMDFFRGKPLLCRISAGFK